MKIKLVFVLCVIFLGLNLLLSGLAANEEPSKLKVQYVKGQIVDMDWVSQKISVKWFDEEENDFDEITIFVPSKTVVYRDTDVMSFSELNIGDNVKIEYCDSSPGPLKAIKIEIMH